MTKPGATAARSACSGCGRLFDLIRGRIPAHPDPNSVLDQCRGSLIYVPPERRSRERKRVEGGVA